MSNSSRWGRMGKSRWFAKGRMAVYEKERRHDHGISGVKKQFMIESIRDGGPRSKYSYVPYALMKEPSCRIVRELFCMQILSVYSHSDQGDAMLGVSKCCTARSPFGCWCDDRCSLQVLGSDRISFREDGSPCRQTPIQSTYRWYTV